MARTPDYRWFESAAVSVGLTAAAGDANTRRAEGVTAGHPWHVTASFDPTTESSNSYDTVFLAPNSACPPVDLSALRAGQSPQMLELRRSDRTGGSVGGGLADAVVVTAISVFRSLRKQRVTTPRERVSVSSSPTALARDDLIDRVACWPGDACYGSAADVAPESMALAVTPEGGLRVSLSVSPWAPLRMDTNAWGNTDQLLHAIALWRDVIDHLATHSALVQRDPATIRQPTSQETSAALEAMSEQVRAAKMARRRQRP